MADEQVGGMRLTQFCNKNNYSKKNKLLAEQQGFDPLAGTGMNEYGVPVPENLAEQAGEQAGVWDQGVVQMSAAGEPRQIKHGPTGEGMGPMPGAA